ncbi:hypothetical protein ACIRQY_06995 [Streptomyces sp. NPDC101490]|uniref:hypothetical protein n=1 Tax=Streptomyces sp. NPDC101490 TaxID=3366143 RepID=UPI0038059837
MDDTPENKPTPPGSTMPTHCPPGDVGIGDYVLLENRYRRVNDMRSKGGANGRVLLLEGYGPWLMTAPREIRRPINLNQR